MAPQKEYRISHLLIMRQKFDMWRSAANITLSIRRLY